MNLEIRKMYPIIVITFTIILIIFMYISGEIYVNKFYKKSFSGKISNIEFSVQGFPIISLGDKEIYLAEYGSKIGKVIEIGDSVAKRNNSWELLIFKDNEKEPIMFYPPKRKSM